jgi:hypothetical protein
MNPQDKKVQSLIKKIEQKKSLIKDLGKPHWVTNCVFNYDENISSNSINIQTVNSVDDLVKIFGFIRSKCNDYEEAYSELNIDTKINSFKWRGFTVEEWKTDIRRRIDILNINKTKEELGRLEKLLDQCVSTELKTQMMLDQVEQSLNDM